MSSHGRRFYEFGPFRLDTAQHLLTRDGEKIPIPPKAFDTLLVLIENKDRVMDKGELLKVIWPDTFVEDANLAVNISVLRKMLGERDDGGHSDADHSDSGHSSDKLDRFRAHVKKEIELFRGREAETFADHFMAVFDGPGRAIRCAVAIRDAALRLGIRTRTGLHTGECDAIGDKIGGNAVETGVQVAGIADESEVLVSRTVKDLVAGSGLKFEDRGLHSFGDALGEWQLFAVK